MKYGYTIIYVENVKETITFYERAFGFQQKFITPENDYGELISGETTIAFASLTLGNTNLRNGYIPSISSQKSNDESCKPFGAEMAFVTWQINFYPRKRYNRLLYYELEVYFLYLFAF